MPGFDNSPTPAPVSGLQDDPSESTLVSERLSALRHDVHQLNGRMERFETGHRDLLEAMRIGNAKADEQIGFLKRKEEREIAAQEASKEAKIKQIEHEQKLAAERWTWWRETVGGKVLVPIVGAITAAISAAVTWWIAHAGAGGPPSSGGSP